MISALIIPLFELFYVIKIAARALKIQCFVSFLPKQRNAAKNDIEYEHFSSLSSGKLSVNSMKNKYRGKKHRY